MPLKKRRTATKMEYCEALYEYYVWMRITGFLPKEGRRLPAVWSCTAERRKFMELNAKLRKLEEGLGLDVVDQAYFNRTCEDLTAHLEEIGSA